jgi:uncharacterized BrkB/YihY/UPF0761 family membrane protein
MTPVARAVRALFLRAGVVVRLTGQSFWRGFLGFYHSDDLTYAASIAYYSLLSLFPFFLLALALLARVAADASDRAAVLEFVLRYFPAQFDFITRQLDAFRDTALTLGVAGTAALMWGAVGVFGAISTAVNYAWGVEKQRSFWKHKLFSFLMLVVASLILLAALLLVSASQMVGARWFADVLAGFPGLLILRGFTVRHATYAAVHRRGRLHFLLRAEREGAVSRRLDRRGRHRPVVERARSRRSPGTSATCHALRA